MSGVQPFQFEPTYPLGEEPIDFAEESEEGAAATDFEARIRITERMVYLRALRNYVHGRRMFLL